MSVAEKYAAGPGTNGGSQRFGHGSKMAEEEDMANMPLTTQASEDDGDSMDGSKRLRTFSNVAVDVVEDMEGDKKPAGSAFFPAHVPWIINPKSPYMRKWDVVMLALLLFTALITPYEVAFMDTSFNFLFMLNRMVDLLFFKDLIMNFFVATLNEMEGTWVVRHRTLACNYLSGWFTIDFVSILPFDTIGLVMDSATVERLKILRVVRLFRLFKLFRIFRASRIFSRWESHISISYSWLSLTKFMVSVAAVSHWLACFWRLTVDIEENLVFGQPVNWMTEYSYVSQAQYITALYWSVMTLTTIGYGDVAPVTMGEQILCIFAMLLGGSIYAYVIGAVCGIVSSMDEATTAYHKTMDELNIFMVENKLPKDLRIRLREYFQHCRQLQRAQHYQDLLVHMSPMLRGEVAVFCNREWVLKVPFFNGAPDEETNHFITSIALALVLEAYAPHETIIKKGEPTEKMYIVQRGVVSRLGHVYSSGACVGEDMILKGAKRTSDVRALTYVDVSGLHRDALLDIVNRGHFPVISKIIRNAAIRMALRREFIHYAKSIATIRKRKPLIGGVLTDQDVQGAKLRDGRPISSLALTPRGLLTGSTRALADSVRSADAKSVPKRKSPLRAQPLVAVELDDDADLNLLQAAVDVSPSKANDEAALVADAEFKRVIADAERELGLPGSGTGAGGPTGFRRSSLLDRISNQRRGARRSLDGITNPLAATKLPATGLSDPRSNPAPTQRHAAEEAAGVSPASLSQGRYLEPLDGGVSATTSAIAGRRLSAGRGAAGDIDIAADAAAATSAHRAVMRLITQRCNHVERLMEANRVAVLHRLSDVDREITKLEQRITMQSEKISSVVPAIQALKVSLSNKESFFDRHGLMLVVAAVQLLLLLVLIVQHSV